jgi:hypothetical protein
MRVAAVVGLAIVTLASCGPRPVGQTGGSRADDPDGSEVAIRFAIEVDGRQSPFFVVPFEESAQVGWVQAYRNGELVYFQERCEIEECGLPPAVCGAALATVLDLARQPSRRIETVWDGTTSVIDPAIQCERREPVAPGDFVARFCYGFEAELEREADEAGPVAGRLIDRQCTDVPFELGDSLVLLSR